MVLVAVAPTAIAKNNVNADVESRVKSILKSLTLEQKVGQMVQGEIKSVTPADVTKYHLGSILNGGGSFPNGNKNAQVSDWLALADEYYHASIDTSEGGAGIPILWGTDAVHGHNNVIGATLFPHNIGLGAANDPKLMHKIGEITAREVAVTGIDWLFAPTVAVVKDSRWGRTYEGYSSESPIVKSYAGEFVLGVQGEAQAMVETATAGICIEPENAAELAAAVVALADDRDRAAAYGEAGRVFVEARFNRRKLASKMERVLLGLVGERAD